MKRTLEALEIVHRLGLEITDMVFYRLQIHDAHTADMWKEKSWLSCGRMEDIEDDNREVVGSDYWF